VRIEVIVYYPSSRDLRGTFAGAAGWKDCLAESAAGRVTCHGLRFYGQKGNFQ
jgi:hypothetical protein